MRVHASAVRLYLPNKPGVPIGIIDQHAILLCTILSNMQSLLVVISNLLSKSQNTPLRKFYDNHCSVKMSHANVHCGNFFFNLRESIMIL